ncbi:Alpha/beta hydrolase-3 [Corchorus capsularis]|uniref:Alpha/beta hydrolase-3 n=1 Tax=Corchorus capsularis TaxID=210143 RepID=A0A1R3J623_COCAP|nr:Alpha/beta hydrolase-3 [Corchorus capsularis]
MRRRRSMAAIAVDQSLISLKIGSRAASNHDQHGGVIEEIEGLIKVYKDGHVERPAIVPYVTAALAPELGVTSKDIVIDKLTNVWARFYVPNYTNRPGNQQLIPLAVYFHGGGFCVGSTAWICYHEFLAKLAAKAGCVIMSINYRLAPENPLPAAYEDGIKSVMWLKQEAGNYEYWWWSKQCDFSSVFLAGDSAGANIAHNVAARLGSYINNPLTLKGTILIQPFFGGEARTDSEKKMVQSPRSALSLAASDTYWRLALPCGTNRDHPWCNPLPLGKGSTNLPPTLVCISEMDILKDRNLEFCAAMEKAGQNVEHVMYKGVGHAFQVLSKSQLSQTRTHEMIAHLNVFLHH